MQTFFIVGLVILGLVFGPLVTIWALNTLFPLAIPYSIATWGAVVVLGGFFKTNISAKS